MPIANDPPCPPITATACASCAFFRKSPIFAKPAMPAGGAAPFFTNIITLPDHEAELFFISLSRSFTFTATMSASSPPALVEPTHPPHRNTVKANGNRRYQFGFGGNAGPSVRDLPFLRMHIFQAHRRHLAH